MYNISQICWINTRTNREYSRKYIYTKRELFETYQEIEGRASRYDGVLNALWENVKMF